MVIYFSKINLESTELLKMYQEKSLDGMKKKLMNFFESGVVYEVEDSFKSNAGELHFIKTKYRLFTGIKTDEYVSGTIYKTTVLYYKKLNTNTGKIEPGSIPTIEDIKFYFDVNKEIVGFHTRQRFGYREFNRAFAGLINMCMEKNGSQMRFSASLYNEGMEIKELERELKSIGNIKRLEFNFKLPNPSDDKMLDKLKNGLTDTAKMMKEANAHIVSVIFDSDGNVGLNIDSCEIRDNIERVAHLTKGVSDVDAIKNGYARVIATGKNGKRYTTEDCKPIKRETISESSEEFFSACKDTISNIFRKHPK